MDAPPSAHCPQGGRDWHTCSDGPATCTWCVPGTGRQTACPVEIPIRYGAPHFSASCGSGDGGQGHGRGMPGTGDATRARGYPRTKAHPKAIPRWGLGPPVCAPEMPARGSEDGMEGAGRSKTRMADVPPPGSIGTLLMTSRQRRRRRRRASPCRWGREGSAAQAQSQWPVLGVPGVLGGTGVGWGAHLCPLEGHLDHCISPNIARLQAVVEVEVGRRGGTAVARLMLGSPAYG